MITIDNFAQLLLHLGFKANGKYYNKFFNDTIELAVNFKDEQLIYPESEGLIINERQTCNFSSAENFVVFECVHRLLSKGYKPSSIELEPKWKLGHGASGGRADILIKNQNNQPLLLIECKTVGKEFAKAWKKTEIDGDQLFSYAQQIQATQFLCLYTSDFDTSLNYQSHIISHRDNQKILDEDSHLNSFKDARDVIERYKVWRDTYKLEFTSKGIFEDNIQAYSIGKDKYTLEDLKTIDARDKEGKYHQFRTILRKHSIARRENAFEVLVNLFLCKIVDETENVDNLKFYWKGIAYDNYYDLVDRLQELYKIGMERFLDQEIIYISNDKIDEAFWAVAYDKNATKKTIKALFKQLKFYKGLDFDFIKVHNKQLFDKNAKVLIEIVQMWQDSQLRSKQQNQFLGDMFEFFLDNGIKQSEGQFFTPMPICRFILMALPLETMIKDSQQPPKVIDYACGAGHFLNEYAAQIKPYLDHSQNSLADYYSEIIGIEKEDRLAKVAKVSAFMYGQNEITIIDGDALAEHNQIKLNSFDLLIANPPFAVEGFLEPLEQHRENYSLLKTVSDIETNRNIQCFFLERAEQLLAPKGFAAFIVPSSVLSNSDSTHIATRELLIKQFDIVAIVELGSGTFGKTGTNTVVLFMRRKHHEPTKVEQYFNRIDDWFEHWQEELISNGGAYQDIHFVRAYCAHIGIDFEHYQSLLNGELSAELMHYELFKDYYADFNSSNDIKKLNAQKSFKELSNSEQQAELIKRFYYYVKVIEKDKLYYFVLAYHIPNQVLVVKSPSDNKEQKSFLGYEWSSAKNNEGIKLITDTQGNHLTPLYDLLNRDNPEKINHLIAQNFLSPLEIPEVLQSFASYHALVDLLDFSRKDFSKAISLDIKAKVAIESQWELIRIESVLLKVSGNTTKVPNKDILDSGEYPVITQEMGKIISGYTNNEKVITDLPLIIFGDHSCTFKFIDFPFVRGADGTQLLKVDTNHFLPKCFFYLIQLIKITNSEKYERHFKYLAKAKIPKPPLPIQQKIIDEIDEIDRNKSHLLKDNMSTNDLEVAVKEAKQLVLTQYL